MADSKLSKVNNLLKKQKIEVIDLKAIDLTGRLHHISLPVNNNIMNKLLKEGVGFDGSSYGFRKVENSDMILIPDLDTAVLDPFRDTPTLSFYSNILLTDKNRSAFSQDGRRILKNTELLLQKSTGADRCMWGPEFEFYIFSQVSMENTSNTAVLQHLTTKLITLKNFINGHITRLTLLTFMTTSEMKHANFLRCWVLKLNIIIMKRENVVNRKLRLLFMEVYTRLIT